MFQEASPSMIATAFDEQAGGGSPFTWEMLGWKVLCKVLVSTCSGTSP